MSTHHTVKAAVEDTVSDLHTAYQLTEGTTENMIAAAICEAFEKLAAHLEEEAAATEKPNRTIDCWACRGTGLNHGDGTDCDTCEGTGLVQIQIVGTGR